MRMQDLRQLPKLRDSLSYLYVEHCRVEKEAQAIAVWDTDGKTPVPCASLALLMLGPGTNLTHAAALTLADNNCLIAWCGEHGVRQYAFGVGGTRSAATLLQQARLVSDPDLRCATARRLYQMRFQEEPDPSLTLEQLRGWEGRRVRDAYARASQESGVPWEGRCYDRGAWVAADPVNRALSAANSCLYGICHAGILSMGLSPALGFIHTGKQLSFVYDVADLYKTTLTIPTAFAVAGEATAEIERTTRLACRQVFQEAHLLERLASDLPRALDLKKETVDEFFIADEDMALPGGLWDPDSAVPVAGGLNYSELEE